MLIPVYLHEETDCQEVPAYLLDRLIAMGRVRSFRRSNGWVVIGRDPVRESGRGVYHGPERRRRMQEIRSCITCNSMVDGECVSKDCPDRYSRTKYYSFT